jgi:hypothetical protein
MSRALLIVSRVQAEDIKKLIDSHVTDLLEELHDLRKTALEKLDAARSDMEKFVSQNSFAMRFCQREVSRIFAGFCNRTAEFACLMQQI